MAKSMVLSILLLTQASASVTFSIPLNVLRQQLLKSTVYLDIDDFNLAESTQGLTYADNRASSLDISNVTLTGLEPMNEYDVSLYNSWQNIYISVENIEATFRFDWSATPTNGTEGWGKIKVCTRFAREFQLTKSKGGRLKVQSYDFNENTGTEWTYLHTNKVGNDSDFVIDYFEKNKVSIQNFFFDAFISYLEHQIFDALKKMTLVLPIDGSKYKIDYSLIANPEIIDDTLEMQTKGQFLYNGKAVVGTGDWHAPPNGPNEPEQYTDQEVPAKAASADASSPCYEGDCSTASVRVTITNESLSSWLTAMAKSPVTLAVFPYMLNPSDSSLLITDFLDNSFPGLLRTYGHEEMYFVCVRLQSDINRSKCEFRIVGVGAVIELYTDVYTQYQLEVTDTNVELMSSMENDDDGVVLHCFYEFEEGEEIDLEQANEVIATLMQIFGEQSEAWSRSGNAFVLPYMRFVDLETAHMTEDYSQVVIEVSTTAIETQYNS